MTLVEPLTEWWDTHRAVSAMEEDDCAVWRTNAMVHGGAVAIMEHLAITFRPAGGRNADSGSVGHSKWVYTKDPQSRNSTRKPVVLSN